MFGWSIRFPWNNTSEYEGVPNLDQPNVVISKCPLFPYSNCHFVGIPIIPCFETTGSGESLPSLLYLWSFSGCLFPPRQKESHWGPSSNFYGWTQKHIIKPHTKSLGNSMSMISPLRQVHPRCWLSTKILCFGWCLTNKNGDEPAKMDGFFVGNPCLKLMILPIPLDLTCQTAHWGPRRSWSA